MVDEQGGRLPRVAVVSGLGVEQRSVCVCVFDGQRGWGGAEKVLADGVEVLANACSGYVWLWRCVIGR